MLLAYLMPPYAGHPGTRFYDHVYRIELYHTLVLRDLMSDLMCELPEHESDCLCLPQIEGLVSFCESLFQASYVRVTLIDWLSCRLLMVKCENGVRGPRGQLRTGNLGPG